MSSSTSNKKDSAGKRLGVKKFGGQEVLKGDIIVIPAFWLAQGR